VDVKLLHERRGTPSSFETLAKTTGKEPAGHWSTQVNDIFAPMGDQKPPHSEVSKMGSVVVVDVTVVDVSSFSKVLFPLSFSVGFMSSQAEYPEINPEKKLMMKKNRIIAGIFAFLSHGRQPDFTRSEGSSRIVAVLGILL
jgi:hypothetical protein